MAYLICPVTKMFPASLLRCSSATLRLRGSKSSTTSRRAMSSYKVPPGAWDAHMHVTDLDKFPPPSTGRVNYKPHLSTLDGARQNARLLSVPNLAFVQPSTYGTDNSCLLWCLQQVTSRHGRGVVVIDHKTIEAEMLQSFHDAGVRGVRVNLKSVNSEPSPSELAVLLKAVDETIKPMKSWAIHIHADMSYMKILRDVVGDLDSKICIDHMGSPGKASIEPQILETDHWAALIDMLQSEQVFVKVSAPYRFAEPSDWPRMEFLVRDLLRCRDGRAAVFASDWPHTRFESTQIKPWVDLCLDWCGPDEQLRTNFFRANAERLFDVDDGN